MVGIPLYFFLKTPVEMAEKKGSIKNCSFILRVFKKKRKRLEKANLGKENFSSGALVIPAERVVVVICSQCVAIGPNVV